jgi:hypothetical protein
VGHLHEFGALVSALTASKSGWQGFYFGPNLPSVKIAFVVKELDAKVLALSLCHKLNDNNLKKELKRLWRLIGRHVTFFVGGSGSVALKKKLDAFHAIVVNDLGIFRNRLEKLTGRGFADRYMIKI